VKLTSNGDLVSPGESFLTGHIPALEGTDLVIWIKYDAAQMVAIVLENEHIHT
jgi:hypothetical protein